MHSSIKFTVEASKTEINFLDTTVYRKGSKIYTKTYKKPTDRASYLHYNSYHPYPLKKNIPYGQALRLRRINTEEEQYQKSIDTSNQALAVLPKIEVNKLPPSLQDILFKFEPLGQSTEP